MSEQQILNYLYWLRERGQSYAVAPQAAPVLASSIKRETSEPRSPPSLAANLRTQAKTQFKVIFLSKSKLDSAEQEMVSRIAVALSLSPDDFCIGIGEQCLPSLDLKGALVILGEEALALSNPMLQREGHLVLSIPHPRAMLLDPRLKISAWETLQRLKAAL